MSSQYGPAVAPVVRMAVGSDMQCLVELVNISCGQEPELSWEFSDTPGHAGTGSALRAIRKAKAFCRSNTIVVEIDGNVAGAALCYPLSDAGETRALAGLCANVRPFNPIEPRPEASFYVSTIAVYPKFQNLGLGALLLQAVEARARQAHCRCLVMEVSPDNDGALRFYARHGFWIWPNAPAIKDPSQFLILQKGLTGSDMATVSSSPAASYGLGSL
jgi:ribosomal protein S18 acetylase RimI-like enzyme